MALDTTALKSMLAAKGYYFTTWKLSLMSSAAALVVIGGILHWSSDADSGGLERGVETVGRSTEEAAVPPAAEIAPRSVTPRSGMALRGESFGAEGFGTPGTGVSDAGNALLDDPLLPTQIPTEPIPETPPATSSPSSSGVSQETPVWSPALLKGGFGFFVGFCVGFAMRMFLRMVAMVAGINFLVLLFAGWLGWVEIQWDVIEAQVTPMLSDLGGQFESFQNFVRGSIPTTGLGALGLYTGVRKQ